MKKIALTLFSLLLTLSIFAQSNPITDATAFDEKTPEQNATALVDYMKTTFKLTETQAATIYDIRLKTAKKIALVDNESRAGLEDKRAQMITADTNLILNKLTTPQMKQYKTLGQLAARKAAAAGRQ